MRILRRFLYLHAGAWAVAGLALSVAPGFFVSRLFDQPDFPDEAWLRIAGLLALGMAMFAVLVAQRATDVWWWSWGVVIPSVAVAAVALVNALGGRPPGASAVLWWLIGIVNGGLALGLLWGLGRTGQERSPT